MLDYRQSRDRIVCGECFGKLKGRWRCLLKRLDFKLENVPYVVTACVILHNICALHGDDCLDEWIDHSPTSTEATATSIGSLQASGVRIAITQYLASHYQ